MSRRTARRGIATLVWLVAVAAAVILAAAALVLALDLDRRNEVVDLLLRTAGTLSVLGLLEDFRLDGRVEAARRGATVTTVLVGWGICAVLYLVVGKVLDRLIRP